MMRLLILTLSLSYGWTMSYQSFGSNNGSTIDSPICLPEVIRCVCGTAVDKISSVITSLKSCMDNVSQSCQMCKGINTASLCSRYALCRTCGDGLDRCLTCPMQRYGQWCDKDCPCLNDGACDETGLCICRHGYSGSRCETLMVTDMYASFNMSTKGLFYDETSTTVTNSERRQRNTRQANFNAECRMITMPENGMVQIETDRPTTGTVAKYTCKENFTMIGSKVRYCMPTGLWSGETPSCERLCSYPITTANINVKINPNRVGPPMYDAFNTEILSELQFYCDDGFVLYGAKFVRCASGVWDHEIPTCAFQLLCDDPGDVAHATRQVTGAIPGTTAHRLGTRITYKCDSGYTLVGKPTITCTPYRYWSAPLPVCINNMVTECTFTCKSPTGTQSSFELMKQALQCKVPSQDDVFVLTPNNS